MATSDLHAQLRLALSAMRAARSVATDRDDVRVFVFSQWVTALLRSAASRDPASLPVLPRSLQRLLLAALSSERSARPSDLSSLIEELAAYVESCAAHERARTAPPVRLPAHRSALFVVAALVITLCALSGLIAARHQPAARASESATLQQLESALPTVHAPEQAYESLGAHGLSRERAASVLPTSTKLEPGRVSNPVGAWPRRSTEQALEAERFRAGRAPRRSEF